MLNAWNWRSFASSSALALASSLLLISCAHGFGGGKPVPLQQPPQESCFIGDSGLQCFDSRLDPGEAPPGAVEVPCHVTRLAARASREEGICYVRPFPTAVNMWCTNPTDDGAQQDWIRTNCHGPKR